MEQNVPALLEAVVGFRLGRMFPQVRGLRQAFIRTGEVSPGDFKMAKAALDMLSEAVEKAQNPKLVFVHKLLYDFVDELGKESQKSQTTEQLDYSGVDGQSNDGNMLSDSGKQSPSMIGENQGRDSGAGNKGML